MSRQTARKVAWGIVALIVALEAIAAFLISLNWSTEVRTQETGDAYSLLPMAGWGLLFLTFGGVGALIIAHQPGNAIGWLVAWFGVSALLVTIADAYVLYALITNPGSLPGAAEAAWWGSLLTDVLLFPELALLFLLIPNGRLLSARWRAVLGGVALLTAFMVIEQLRPGPLTYYPLEADVQIANPYAIQGMDQVFDLVSVASELLMFPILLAALAVPFLRFHRSHGTERQQLKWFALLGIVILLVWGLEPVLTTAFDIPEPALNVLVLPGFFAIPICIGIAILRHGLYDIDVIIRRTLVYGLLTVTLAAMYFAVVLSLGSLIRASTGGSSPVVVAASTLLIAALFRPMRSRIQSIVDRRFYRQKYDAARTLEAFSARLRDEVDLRALTDDLQGAVRETMQPVHVSLWLRPGPVISSQLTDAIVERAARRQFTADHTTLKELLEA